jgi:hypothetical protein
VSCLRAVSLVPGLRNAPHAQAVLASKVHHVVGADGHARVVVPALRTGRWFEPVQSTLARSATDRSTQRPTGHVGGHVAPGVIDSRVQTNSQKVATIAQLYE